MRSGLENIWELFVMKTVLHIWYKTNSKNSGFSQTLMELLSSSISVLISVFIQYRILAKLKSIIMCMYSFHRMSYFSSLADNFKEFHNERFDFLISKCSMFWRSVHSQLIFFANWRKWKKLVFYERKRVFVDV